MSDCKACIPQQKKAKKSMPIPKEPVSAEQSAQYTEEMLNSLEKIAQTQKQPVLAHLLALAAWEARKIGQSGDIQSG